MRISLLLLSVIFFFLASTAGLTAMAVALAPCVACAIFTSIGICLFLAASKYPKNK
jgi:hypothetical protein